MVNLRLPELLSFFSIFGIINNYKEPIIHQVVNCFHFSVSLGYETTILELRWDLVVVELEAFFSIFGIQNNNKAIIKIEIVIELLFIFSVSLGYKTTSVSYLSQLKPFQLSWDQTVVNCFIFQYLLDTKTTFV